MLSRFLPARQKTSGPIADLDAIVAEAVPFKFQGRVHFIKPITLREFLKFTQANADFHSRLIGEAKLTADELAGEYEKVIQSVCDSITKKHILQMEQAQIAALYQLIIDTVTGQVKTGEESEKKKRVRIPLYNFEQVASLPNAPENSVGL
jgi:hypothetical protein